jgi:pimeloyl-ACP methyl ester carboxylesterase
MGLFFTDPLFEDFAVSLGLGLGGQLGEVAAICAQIGEGDDDAWYTRWSAAADRLAEEADQAAARGHLVGAHETYRRASLYYAVSYHPLFGAPVDPRLLAAFRKQSEVFARAAATADPPGEEIEIPFGNATLSAWLFRAADGGEPRPLLIATSGYDSTVFESYLAQGLPAQRRGYHCLIFDGPGQGRPLYQDGIVMRPDWETVIGPVVGAALQRPEVDPQRIALTGWSLGGHLALRAATGEHRLAACIADPALFGIAEVMQARMQAMGVPAAVIERLPDLDEATLAGMTADMQRSRMQHWMIEQRGFWVHGVHTLLDYLRVAAEFTLAGRVDRIDCPTLLCAAEDDPLSSTATVVHDQLTAPTTLLQFTSADGAGDHCEMGNRALFNLRAFDWLDETLSAGRTQPLTAGRRGPTGDDPAGPTGAGPTGRLRP